MAITKVSIDFRYSSSSCVKCLWDLFFVCMQPFPRIHTLVASPIYMEFAAPTPSTGIGSKRLQ